MDSLQATRMIGGNASGKRAESDFLFEQEGKHSPLMDVMWVIWERGSIVRYVPLERPEREAVSADG